MSETFCGKSCAECAHKDALNCPGCKVGPGRQLSLECDLAQCCRSKGHKVCETCGFKEDCRLLRSRDLQPENRKRKSESEQLRRKIIEDRVPVLRKWLWILFWLTFPAAFAGNMRNDAMLSIFPADYIIFHVLGECCSIAYGAIFLRLSAESDGYKTAGICVLICASARILVACIPNELDALTLEQILALPTLIVSLIGTYNAYHAHAAVLTGVDNDLSAKWKMVWKLDIGFTLGMYGCILLVPALPVLGSIALLITTVGMLITGVLVLVYLYKTARAFREYPVKIQ